MKLAELQRMKKPLVSSVDESKSKYTIEFRLEVLAYKRNNSTRAAAEKFDVATSFILRWVKEHKLGMYNETIEALKQK